MFRKKDTGFVLVPEGYIPSMTDNVVTQEAISNLLLILNVKRGNGPGNVPTKFLRRYPEWASHNVSVIFILSLSQGTLPFD